MTSKVAKVLREIDMSEYIEVFEDKGIDYDTMLALKKFPDMISQIIPNIRDQMKFRLSLDSICEVNSDTFEKTVGNATEQLIVWEEDTREKLPKEDSRKRNICLAQETQQNNIEIEVHDDLSDLVWKRICMDAGIESTVCSEDADIQNHTDQRELEKENCFTPEAHQNNVQGGSNNLVENKWKQICIESVVGKTEDVDESSRIRTDQQENVRITKSSRSITDQLKNGRITNSSRNGTDKLINGSSRNDKQENYIFQALQTTAMGKGILGHYKEGLFDDICRTELAKQIIYAEYGTNLNTIINTPRFVELAELIVECFPGEHRETYYIPLCGRGDGQTPSGKLYDIYCTFNKFLRDGGLRNSLNGSPEKSSLPSVTDSVLEELQQKLDFLSTCMKPWENIKECWESTSNLRLQKLQDANYADFKLSDYIRKFPVLCEPGSHVLLEYDFEILFPEAAGKWQLKWPFISQKLKQVLIKHGVKKKNLDCDAAILYHFPLLFSVAPVKIPNQKPWRASKSEIQEGFLVHLKAIEDYEETLERMQQSVCSRGMELLPVPFIVGDSLENITDSFVTLNGKLLEVESPSRAVEVTLKMYHALNCNYPVQSARMWTVLGHVIFDIKGIVENNNTAIVRKLIKILT